MITIAVFEATAEGKRRVGYFWLEKGGIKFSGDLGQIAEDLRSGRWKAVVGDKVYNWGDGEEFLRALPSVIHGTYLWAEEERRQHAPNH